VRQAQAVFGGGAVTTPYVTWGLLVLNVLAYAVQSVLPQVVNDYGMAAGAVAYGGEWWRLLTGAFLHSSLGGGGFSLTHILFNMLALYIIGPELERWLGAARFLALYLLSALGGSVAIYLLSEFLTVGASGAIYGMFGALFVIAKKLGRDVRGLLWLIGINVAITLIFPLLRMIPALGGLPGVSWQGHLGGLVTGVVVAVILAYAPARNRTTVQTAGCATVLLLLVATVALLPPFAYDTAVVNGLFR
jgi:membrane associated rhomboid family serine protease